MAQFDLRREAAKFADELSTLLNGTVCDGVTFCAMITNPGRVVIGYKIDKFNLDSTRGIPITLGSTAVVTTNWEPKSRNLRVLAAFDELGLAI